MKNRAKSMKNTHITVKGFPTFATVGYIENVSLIIEESNESKIKGVIQFD